MVEDDAAGDIGEDCAAVLVDGKKKISAGVKCEANDVFAMGKGKRVRLRAGMRERAGCVDR